jgi:hypothetical protein
MEKKTPNSSPFTVLGHFFITSSIRESYEGFWMLKVQKISSLSLLLKTNIKFMALTGPPISQCARSAVHLLHLRGYINRRAGEKLSQHLLLLRRCAAEKFD